MATHYELLGIPATANADAVRNAWRHLARAYHPDRSAGDADAADRFRLVVQAYQVLGDPARRREYDLALGLGVAVGAAIGGSGGGAEALRARVPDRAICVGVPYAINLAGGTLPVTAPGVGICPECEGNGSEAGRCWRCAGSGLAEPSRVYPVRLDAGLLELAIVRIPRAGWPSDFGRGDLVVQVTLENPPGMTREGTTIFTTAQVPRSTSFLGGTVTVASPDGEHRFHVPAHTPHGSRFAFPGLGLRSGPGGARGELVVTISVR